MKTEQKLTATPTSRDSPTVICILRPYNPFMPNNCEKVTVLFKVMLINDVIGCWVNVYNRQNFSFCLMINYNYTYCTYKTSTKTFFINYKNVQVKCWSWNCQITSQQIEKQIYKIIKNKLNIKVIWDQLIIMLFQC